MKLTEFQALFDASFASDAESGTLTFPLPASKPQTGRLGVRQGFPVETMTPIAAGGVPPHGADLNGVLRMLSLSCQRSECGLILPYSANFSTAIGGYPKTALVTFGQDGDLWMSQVDENQSSPDAADSQWQPLFANLVRSPDSRATGTAVRAITLNETEAPDKTVLSVEVGLGTIYEVPSLSNVQARLSPMIQSTRGEAVERVIRTMRVDSVSDSRGGFIAVIDEDGATTKLISDLMAVEIAQDAARVETANCVRTQLQKGDDLTITYLSADSDADSRGALLHAQSNKDSNLRLPSVPYVEQMLKEGDGLPNLKAENGYVTLPGGVVMQWGVYRTSKSDGTIDVLFPLQFPTSCASVTVTEREANGTWFNSTPTVHGVLTKPTLTGFKAVTRLFTSTGQNLPHEATGSYLAIGY